MPTNTSRVSLRAEAKQLRDGVLVMRGDPFKASPEEAKDLIALNFASAVTHDDEDPSEAPSAATPTSPDPPPAAPAGGGKPRLASKPAAVPKKKVPAKSKPGRYRRHDLRADDDSNTDE